MKRAGFTMIELIFVIVILGILAAVAIPKLAATRDDAKIAKGATELATAVSDIGAYYTANGALTKAETMTNVFAGKTDDFNTTGTSLPLNGADCITITSEGDGGAGGGTDTINIKYDSSSPTSLCKGIAQAAASIFGKPAGWNAASDANLSHKFGGSKVTF
jgi:general secretion pathway protein G